MELAPRRPWADRRIVLGVCGGIAAYKSAQLARDLTRLGARVDVVLTRSAAEFIGPITFEGLTGRATSSDILAPGSALDHIRLAREADVVCVAPATADFMARAAAGRADDLLAAILLATDAPVVICPAMNDRMWAHPQTRANAEHLSGLGYRLVGPGEGPLAFGEGSGPGRLEEPSVIIEHLGRTLGGDERFGGRRILVTAGATREPVDAVRFLSNRSSGRMGYALAGAAWRRGAEVLLVSGPSALSPPAGVELRRADSAAEMSASVASSLADADALIMCAAVADFRPARPREGKIKKESAPGCIPIEPTPDVLAETLELRPPHLAVLGFALEAGDGRSLAKAKLLGKKLDMIALNDLSDPGSGFEVSTNRVTLFDRDGGEEDLPLMDKDSVAELILDRFGRFIGPAS